MALWDMALLVQARLSISEVVNILKNPPTETEKITLIPPQKAKGGQAFLFKAENVEKQNDWRCDQYRWKNEGVTKLPRKDPQLRKMYFSVDTPNGTSKGFQRHAYQLLHDSDLTLIHYVGDENEATNFCHRNSTKGTSQNFVRTCPSYMKKCEYLVKDKNPNIVYKKEIASMDCDPLLVPVETPRNLKQLRNLRHKHLHQSRISHDALYNIHELAYDIPGFVHKITTFPDLVCVCGLQEIIDEADKVLCLNHPGQLLSYDTTFQLGDFYVSPLVFRHTVFQQRPSIPVLFLIHERKLMETHQDMFKICVKAIQSLKKATCAIVTDREKAILKSLCLEMPTIAKVHCWNHIIRDIRFWCRKHGAPTADIAVYIDDVNRLFHCSNLKDYKSLLELLRPKWDAGFEEYYMKEIHDDVPLSIGRWVLEKYNVYSPYSGITNNQSESLNRVLKDIQGWKEAPFDCLLLSLYQLQAFHNNEIKRGLAGLGEYKLAPQCISLKVEETSLHYIPCTAPEYIVRSIKEGNNQETFITCSSGSAIPESGVVCLSKPSVTPKADDGCSSVTVDVRNLSINSRAKMLLKDDYISYDAKLHVFIVKGTSEANRVVTLFPKETCSCPANQACYHIIGAKLFLGMPIAKSDEKKPNLALLRRNVRGKKKCGRKRPRQNDCDPVLAADDQGKCDLSDNGKSSGNNQNLSIITDDQSNPCRVSYAVSDQIKATKESCSLESAGPDYVRDPQCSGSQLSYDDLLFDDDFYQLVKDQTVLWRIEDYQDENESQKPLLCNEGEFHMYKSADVRMWMKCREYMGKVLIEEREKGFIVMNDVLEKEYEAFRLELGESAYLPENDLLHLWHKEVDLSSCKIVQKYGESFVKLISDEIDSFYLWMTEQRSQLSTEKTGNTSSAASETLHHNDVPDVLPLTQNMHDTEETVDETKSDTLDLVVYTSRSAGKGKKRRRACKQCIACCRPDCGQCGSCKDMIKFGGQGRQKRRCQNRVCNSLITSKGPDGPDGVSSLHSQTPVSINSPFTQQMCSCKDMIKFGGTGIRKKRCLNRKCTNSYTIVDGDNVVKSDQSISQSTVITTASLFLIKIGREIFNIKADGNCLFRALSHQLYGTDEHHLLVRTSLVRYELFNQERFQAYVFTNQDISLHAKEMSTPGTHIELLAAATLFGFSIYMLEKCRSGFKWIRIDPLENNHDLIVPYQLPNDSVTVNSTLTHLELYYVTNIHFDSVVLQTTKLTATELPIMSSQTSSIDLTIDSQPILI